MAKRTTKRTDLQPSALGLKQIRLLEGIPPSALQELAGQCRWKPVSAGQRVISRNAPDNDVYMIVAGHVRATAYSAAGRQVNYREMRAGEWFGEFAAIDGLSRSADVVAIDDSLVAAMSPAVFRQLLRDHAVVCDRMLLRLTGTVRDLTDRLFELSTLGVQNRVHAEVLRLARQAGITGNAARIYPAPNHDEIASNISTYREQVTRVLSTMRKQGLVRGARRALEVPDVERLEKIVAEVRRSG